MTSGREAARPGTPAEWTPLVTVVTPSFQYARYLPDCLDSVRRQTYPRIEHLVLDACSTDGSAEVIASFQGRYPLRAWFEPDLGQADALNKGFARAQGEVFCWLNADDLWLHERVVEEAVAMLRGGAEVASGGGWVIDAEGRRVKPLRAHPRRAVRELRAYDTLLQPATFWRAAVHRPLRSDLHYVFDWQLFLELQGAGARFEVRDTDWAGYRMHSVNKTAADPARRRHEVAALLRAQFGARSLPHLWSAAVARGYDLSERRRWPALKRALQLANTAVFFLSGRRVVSC